MSAQKFCFPVRELSNDRVKLTPFSAERHANTFLNRSAKGPDPWAYMPIGPFADTQDFTSNFLERFSSDPGWFTFAVIDKTKPPSPEDDEGELAGTISLLDTSTTHLSTEIGGIVILPPFQRTHVTTNAVGLLLQYALDGIEAGGLGLRRVQWKANTLNVASIRTATRVGFRHEGVLRWHMNFRDGDKKKKVGNGLDLPKGSPAGDYGRDTVILGLCWDDWEGGVRGELLKAMARTN